MKVVVAALALAGAPATLRPQPPVASAVAWPLKSDETVVVFPSLAVRETGHESAGWIIPLRGWVFEREADSSWRNATIGELGRRMGLTPEQIASEPFRTRARAFIHDNERGKRVVIRVGERTATMPETGADGHFQGTIRLTDQELASVENRGSIELRVDNAGEAEVVTAPARVVRPDGVVVVCDLDDTIKVSNIGNAGDVLRSALVEAYVPVAGMRDLCRRFAGAGAEFSYLSASPWQLYEPLAAFLRGEGFPDGSVTLREFRLKDGRIVSLFEDPSEFKRTQLTRLRELLPQRRFVLIGDATENDAGVYAAFARQHPGIVEAIFIRVPPGEDAQRRRAEAALGDLPQGTRGVVFDDPSRVRLEADGPGPAEPK